MADTVEPLVLDLLEWIGREPRPYSEVIEVWRTSCPRLPVWEEANARGFVERQHRAGSEAQVRVSAAGRAFLRSRRAAREPLPRLAGKVVLRRLDRADLSAFQAYRSDAAVGRYQGWSALTDQEALAFIEEMSTARLFPSGDWVQLALAERQTDSLVGDIGVCVAADGESAEIGITLAPRFQGRGLATEALREAIALVFAHSPAGRIVCITDARNEASVRLLERAGMRRVAPADAVFKGEPCTEHTYAVSRNDGG
jgi:RimJ/RimL family protein N-acetyltransferase